MAHALSRQVDGQLDHAAVTKLRNALRGALLQPSDPGYGEARSIWNGMITRQPALIARVSGAADVIACVNFARENGLPLSIRGGGHNVAGAALCEGGLMIDMSLAARGACRCRPPNCSYRRRRHLGRRRPRDAAVRPRGPERDRVDDRRRGLHHGRRVRLDLAQVRLCGRQPLVGRCRHRRRRASPRERDAKTPICSGHCVAAAAISAP